MVISMSSENLSITPNTFDKDMPPSKSQPSALDLAFLIK
jgi:hypothetical protein